MKRRYYCQQENEDISRQDVHLEAVRSRIQSYMASMGFPAQSAPEEYSTHFEKILGDDKERQSRHLAALLAEDKATLCVGNRVLGAMLPQQRLQLMRACGLRPRFVSRYR